jgi:hypothetical protein
MHIVTTILFTLAVFVGLAPPLAPHLFWDGLSGWGDDLSKSLILFGAAIPAAGLALIGIALKNWNKMIISARQLAARRREEEHALARNRQQMASAFIGEIDLVLNELNASLAPAIENTLPAMQSGEKEIVERVHIAKSLGVFDNSPMRVKLFPRPISQCLTRFYSINEETRANLAWCDRVIEIYTNHNIWVVTPMRLTRLYKQTIGQVNASEKLGRTLIDELKKIRDTDIEADSHGWSILRDPALL